MPRRDRALVAARERRRRRQHQKYWLTVGAVMLVAGVATLVMLAAVAGRRQAGDLIAGLVCVGVMMTAVAVGVWGLIELATVRCPECRAGGTFREVDRRSASRRRCYGLVTRRAYSSGGAYIPGDSRHRSQYVSTHGSMSWQERVPVIRTVWQHLHECRAFGFREVRESVEEVEDFG